MNKLTCTLSEATTLTGLSRSSLYRAFSEGRLSPKKVGKRTLIRMDDLESFVAGLPDANLAKVG